MSLKKLSLLTGRWVLRAACSCGVPKRHPVKNRRNCASTSRRTHTMMFWFSSVVSFCTPFSEANVTSKEERGKRKLMSLIDSHFTIVYGSTLHMSQGRLEIFSPFLVENFSLYHFLWQRLAPVHVQLLVQK